MDLYYQNVEEIVVEKPIKLSNLDIWATHIFIRFHGSEEIDDGAKSILTESKITLYSKNKKNLKMVKE